MRGYFSGLQLISPGGGEQAASVKSLKIQFHNLKMEPMRNRNPQDLMLSDFELLRLWMRVSTALDEPEHVKGVSQVVGDLARMTGEQAFPTEEQAFPTGAEVVDDDQA